jgi:hypothetical protein
MKSIARFCLLSLFLLLAAGCAITPPHPQSFSFAVTGDTPYTATEEVDMEWMIEDLGHLDLAFIVHVGDFKAGSNSPCTDALFDQRKRQFDKSAHPFIYVPGDNDWVDCRRSNNGGADALERLQRLREVFFAKPRSLGKTTLPLDQPDEECIGQAGKKSCSRYSENAMWERGGVVFATLNIQGSNNNLGFDAASDAEFALRENANEAWMQRAFARANQPGMHGLVLLLQANPGFEEKMENVRKSGFRQFLEAFSREAGAFAKPVLFVHGDTHLYRIDAPLRNPLDGKRIANATRLETYGSPVTGWVKVTVDQNHPALFRIQSGGTYP